MHTGDDGPADTRMMAIVHAALRRDLERARRELTTAPYPVGDQRRALGDHIGWLMQFLHDHHTSEDAGLWPLVRSRNPGAAALLDSLEADHQQIAPAISALVDAAAACTSSADDGSRTRLVDALADLDAVLTPHLDREVAEAMPVVSTSITAGDYRRWENEYNLKGRSARELGLVGHWLIDGIDAEGYALVVGVVPPVQRFVLLHGFARAYRRAARARWRPETARAVVAAR